jgi:hypothetical protein
MSTATAMVGAGKTGNSNVGAMAGTAISATQRVAQGTSAVIKNVGRNAVAAMKEPRLSPLARQVGAIGNDVKPNEVARNIAIGAEKLHGHHSFPKALGGHPDQRLSDMIESMHTGKGGIHSDLANFENGWLRPKKGMTGAQIVDKYGQNDVVEGLRRFYSMDKWNHLSSDFEDAVDFTSKMSE